MKSAAYRMRYLHLLIVLLLFGRMTVDAQRYPFFNIGIEEGLVQSQVMALAQDAGGHLWAGTLGGLSCYDGHTFRAFTVRDGLPSNEITALFAGTHNTLWIGTGRGLCTYDGHRFRRYSLEDTSGAQEAVTQVTGINRDTVWCIASRRLYQATVTGTSFLQSPGGVSAICADIAGGLWVACSNAYALYHLNSGNHYDSLPLPVSAAPLRIYRMRQDAAGRLLLITVEGIYRLEHNTWSLLIQRKSPQDALLYSFNEGSDGSYWFGASTGALRYANGAIQRYTKETGLTDLTISESLTDHEGNIWLGSNGEGLYRFSGATFTSVDEQMGLHGPQVSSIAQDESGTVYFGSYDGGLYRYRNAAVTAIPLPEGAARRPVSALLIRGATLWIATQGAGLWQYGLKSGRLRRFSDDPGSAACFAFVPDGDNGLLSIASKGVFAIHNDTMRALSLPAMTIDAATFIGRDSLIIATPDGFLLHHAGKTTPFITGGAADSGQIVCMDYRDGTMWMGTSDNGLLGYNLRTRRSIHVGRADGLRSQFIYNIYAAPDGTVWVGTGYGICRIRPEGARPQVDFFGRSAGLIGMESNRNAVLPLPDGKIWFGTTGGAALYHPSEAAAAAAPVSLQLQGIRVFGEPVHDSNWYNGSSALYGVPQHLRLPWQQNNLSFFFAAISLSGAENIIYRYRLEGLQTPWSEWSGTNTVNFSALPPGIYTLLVQCSTDGRQPQPQSLSYSFEIITPFHKTAWFKLLILGGCIALGVSIQYIIAGRKRRRRALLERLRREEQARVRQRTAEDFHDEVGNKITRINVLTNVLRSKVGVPAPPDVGRLIDSIQDNAGQLYSGTRDILWSLQPANDSLYQVLHRIRDFGLDLFGDTEIAFEMEGIQLTWKDLRLPMDVSRNLIMIFKEALNNALKYAMADKVSIHIAASAGQLTLTLSDDGKGFDPSRAAQGQGMGNIKTRAKRLHAALELSSSPGKGTIIKLTMPLKQP